MKQYTHQLAYLLVVVLSLYFVAESYGLIHGVVIILIAMGMAELSVYFISGYTLLTTPKKILGLIRNHPARARTIIGAVTGGAVSSLAWQYTSGGTPSMFVVVTGAGVIVGSVVGLFTYLVIRKSE
ncbi:hypothetical protein H6784_00365 [Candidatus Nomurabacteria bacterium]|nr:hypothetical protein [Candidatus Kaiserbacteria bacterium]MCB9813846.1 hypothetical protein [Candidatus Nomurabacteria bacterium]